MRADNTRHIVAAARHRHEYTRAKAVQALREAEKSGTPVTFDAVATAAGVSRSWLYTQPDLRAEIERLRAASQRAPGGPVPIRQRASDAALPRRLEAANTHSRQLAKENHGCVTSSPAPSVSNAQPDPPNRQTLQLSSQLDNDRTRAEQPPEHR